jgi:CSLREA domain-containing protein
MEGTMKKRLSLVLVCLGLLICASGASAATITVNSTADTAANTGTCTLREAIVAANTDTASGGAAGECAAGSGTDTIGFSASFNGELADTIAVTVGMGLPLITQPVTIAGGNCGSPKPCTGIDANGATGLDIDAADVSISGLAIFDASGSSSVAIFGSDDPGLVVRNTWLGMSLDQTAVQNQNGIIVLGDNAVIGGTGANDRNVIARTVGSGVRIVGADNATVQGNYMGTKADGTTTATVGNNHGVQVIGDSNIAGAGPPVGTVIGGPEAGVPGTCEAPCNVIANNVSTAIDLTGSGGTDLAAGQTTIEGNFVGLGFNGTDLGSAAVEVGNADNVTVGGDASRRNYVTTEIHAATGATNLDVVANFVGLNTAGTARVDDDATIRLGAIATPITGANVTGNRIAALSGTGPAINLAATSSVVQGNVIGIGTGGQNVGGGGAAIFVNGGSANQIGGTGPGEANVIGNAGTGINLGGNGTTVVGNVIGTDATETQSHPITSIGIQIGGDSNVIGGTTAASENVIANVNGIAPEGDAISVVGAGNDLNSILRNRGSAVAGQEFVELRGTFGPGNGASGPNNGIERPTISAGATSAQVSGTGALPGAIVRVYRTLSTTPPPANGPRDVIAYAGQATADGAGDWTLNCPSAGCEVGLPGTGQVTANQTSTTGDSSEMADPKAYTDQPPDTTITSGPANAGVTADSTPTFGLASSEPSSTFECKVDGGSFAACTDPHTTAALSEGSHTFQARATDNTAHTDSTPASRTFTVDLTPPDTQIDSGPAAGSTTADSTPSFGFSATDAGSTFECRIDGSSFAACSGPGAAHTTAVLADGQHTFEVRAADAVGNADTSPASRTFSVDATPPDTQIDSGPAAGSTTADSTPSFGISATEAGSRFECRIDGAAFAACTAPHTTAPLPTGSHTFEVRATDVVGNTDASPATRSFSVDAKAPETTIDKAPKKKTTKRKAKFAFSADEQGATFECMLDKGDFEPCGASAKFKVKTGKHKLVVRATDQAGNVDQTPATAKWKVKKP